MGFSSTEDGQNSSNTLRSCVVATFANPTSRKSLSTSRCMAHPFLTLDPLGTSHRRPFRLNRDSRERELVLMRWGLIPYWAKDPTIGLRTINAKAETIRT